MKAIVIGGCGHIGSFLVPMLIQAGYQVTAISPWKEQALFYKLCLGTCEYSNS